MAITLRDGTRSIHVEAEVPGTPAEVWRAVATGEGVSAWFMPTTIDERTGGRIVVAFGPDAESRATITTWDPPHRFVAESADLGADAPAIVTEWQVAARGAGHSLVRVEQRIATERADFDPLLESVAAGWPGFLRVLRIYLAHFSGVPSAALSASTSTAAPEGEAWAALTGALGIADAAVGERRSAPDDAPTLAGLVEHAGTRPHELLLRLDAPAPGIAALGCFAAGDATHVVVRGYLYGSDAASVAAREEPRWRDWLAKRLGAS